MHDVTHDDERKCILQRRACENKQVRKTDDHSRDRVRHKGDAVDHLLYLSADRTPRRDKRCPVGDQCSRQGRDHSHHQGVDIYAVQLAVLKHRLHMLHRKVHPVRPFLDERNDKHDDEHRERTDKDQGAQDREGRIPRRALLELDRGNPVVPYIVLLQDVQHCDADNRRDDHDERHHRAVSEVRHASQHLCVEDACDHLELSAYRGRDTEIRKAQEEGLDKCCRQSSQQRNEDRHPEGLQGRIPHQPGNDHEPLVYVSHRVIDQGERDRQGVGHIAQQQPVESVNVEKLPSEELRQQSLLSEGIDDREAVRDRREQHGQDRRLADKSLISLPEIRIVDRVRKDESKYCRDQGAAHGDQEAVSHRPQESSPCEHFHIVAQRHCGAVSREGSHQNADHRHCKESRKKDCQQRKD